MKFSNRFNHELYKTFHAFVSILSVWKLQMQFEKNLSASWFDKNFANKAFAFAIAINWCFLLFIK